MITVNTSIQVQFAQFCQAMYTQFPTWKAERQVQLAYTRKRNNAGDYYLQIAVNPLGGYRLPAETQEAVTEVVRQMEG